MFTPKKHAQFGSMSCNQMSIKTPPISFSQELRKVLQERNLLTAKTRKKVCSLLNNSGSLSNTCSPDVNKRTNFRLQALEEILSSERTYLNQLQILMKHFVNPLKERCIIDDANHTALFGQIEMIYNLNGEFMRELESNMQNVGQAFLKMAPFFKLYSVYAFDYRSALLILQDLTSKNPVFRKFLEQTESRPEVQRKLNSLMIVPIQRVPRYKLLLEQVLLYTSPADNDFKILKESIKQIESTVSHINACVEDQEITQMLINLQNSLTNRTPNIVKPSRKVVKEGVLQKVTRNGTEISRYCVLMSDIFMYCKILKERTPNTTVENSLECCCIFPLKKCKVYEMFPGTFKVACQGDGIILCSTDVQMGNSWVGFVQDTIDLHVESRKTLRKESSKRTPLRKKEIKKFEEDSMPSSSKQKCDYETIFRNKNRIVDSECESDSNGSTICFQRKKCQKETVRITKNSEKRGAKRRAPQPPQPQPLLPQLPLPQPPQPQHSSPPSSMLLQQSKFCQISVNGENSNCISKMCNYIVPHYRSTKASTPMVTGILKSKSGSHKMKSKYVTSTDYKGFNENIGGNFRDTLFPLHSSGGSNNSENVFWNGPEINDNVEHILLAKRKRVKFDDTEMSSEYCNEKGTVQLRPYMFNNTDQMQGTSLSKKIFSFFSNLF